ncbi:nucleotide exchange factor GrpE [bacterium]|nr:nucleotide exchange factor GrpE [bacterium]
MVRKKKEKKKITLENESEVIDITEGLEDTESLDDFVEELEKPKSKKEKKKHAAAKEAVAMDALKKEIEELKNEVKKMVAENRNQKIRLENEYGKRVEYASESFFKEFILIKDSFDEAMKHIPESETEFDKGVKLLYNNIEQLMEKFNLSSYSALGTIFNPALHQAMQRIDIAEKEENEVIAEYQVGYKYGDRLLRPSMVVVATGNAPAQAEEEKEEEIPPTETEDVDEKTDDNKQQ